MFSKGNLGSLAALFDDEEDKNEQYVSSKREAEQLQKSIETTQCRDYKSTSPHQSISPQEEAHSSLVRPSSADQAADSAADPFADVESWDEATPPTSPLNSSNFSLAALKGIEKSGDDEMKNGHLSNYDSCPPAAIVSTSPPRTSPSAAIVSTSSPRTSPSAVGKKRPVCPYGKDCYRKNPIHLKEV